MEYKLLISQVCPSLVERGERVVSTVYSKWLLNGFVPVKSCHTRFSLWFYILWSFTYDKISNVRWKTKEETTKKADNSSPTKGNRDLAKENGWKWLKNHQVKSPRGGMISSINPEQSRQSFRICIDETRSQESVTRPKIPQSKTQRAPQLHHGHHATDDHACSGWWVHWYGSEVMPMILLSEPLWRSIGMTAPLRLPHAWQDDTDTCSWYGLQDTRWIRSRETRTHRKRWERTHTSTLSPR